jgi:methyltransferase (TIGR00027 family)
MRLVKSQVLQDISDTARWVAHFRALESERDKPLFRDPYARRLAGERGRAIAEELPEGPMAPMGWSVAVRTRAFDDFILEAVRLRAVHTVVNLAAGLDTRPQRLDLPSSLHWIEVDKPGIIEPKNALLANEPAACRLERVALDLSDAPARQALFARINRESSRVLIICEGFLLYLAEAEVAALAHDLRAHFPSALWLLDVVSPAVLTQMQQTWGKTLDAANASMKFAPIQGLGFFEKHGFTPLRDCTLLDEAQRLGREMRTTTLLRWLALLSPGVRRGLGEQAAQHRNAVVYGLMQQRSH